ncbi:hypothetical protein CPter291_1360 [Collimonas pratensis]|uniref:Uncharacterized protein n=1 Tax=Collimonas pratensis TaxID=279113 RepID=A0ABM5Z3I3_9BURK|nr:hypothetical protein CPter291_1360 [Collimonas pratensis]
MTAFTLTWNIFCNRNQHPTISIEDDAIRLLVHDESKVGKEIISDSIVNNIRR